MKKLTSLIFVAVLLIVAVVPAFAQGDQGVRGDFHALYYEGDTVRTLIVPAAFPNQGRDPLYNITNGVADQHAVISVAPGDADYHGGQWAVNLVVWEDDATPYLLTSADDVFAARDAGDLTITRVPAADFLCPVQP